jgi:hypothetical protein
MRYSLINPDDTETWGLTVCQVLGQISDTQPQENGIVSFAKDLEHPEGLDRSQKCRAQSLMSQCYDASDATQHQENDNNEKYKPQSSARVIAPISAVGPTWQRTQES